MITALSERTSNQMTHRLVTQAASEVGRLVSAKVHIIQSDCRHLKQTQLRLASAEVKVLRITFLKLL